MLSVNELNYRMSTRFYCIGSSGAGLEYRPPLSFLDRILRRIDLYVVWGV
jgi:hypothetical protein